MAQDDKDKRDISDARTKDEHDRKTDARFRKEARHLRRGKTDGSYETDYTKMNDTHESE